MGFMDKNTLSIIYGHLSWYDVIQCSRVCKLWFSASFSPSLWKAFAEKYSEMFPAFEELLGKREPTTSIRQFFVENLKDYPQYVGIPRAMDAKRIHLVCEMVMYTQNPKCRRKSYWYTSDTVHVVFEDKKWKHFNHFLQTGRSIVENCIFKSEVEKIIKYTYI